MEDSDRRQEVGSGAFDMALLEMKELVRKRLNYIALCVENGRTQNLAESLENVLSMTAHLSLITDVDDTLDLIQSACDVYPEIFETNATGAHISEQPELIQGKRGPPSFHILRETLEFYIENNFKVKDIAEIIGVSKRTIERRLHHFNLNISQTYSELNDSDLEENVIQIVKQFPHIGYRTVSSILLAEGHRVQSYRVRHAVRNADPEGVLFRRIFLTTCRVQRRTYQVEGAQALWHIDGNHKLIRWRFVIHGGIDGFSRLPVFLKVSTNNRAQTVLDAFIEAVNTYGLPKKVRSDKGGENVLVAEYMLQKRGIENKPFLAGRSVHNQRIERLWREVWNGCTSTYYNLFYFMEDQGILQVDNIFHLQILHLIYLPLIQATLNRFMIALQRRPLRTESNKSPMQLWIEGQTVSCTNDLEIESDLYGIDLEGNSAVAPRVEIPETIPLSEEELLQLDNILKQESSEFGIDIFEQVINHVNSLNIN